MRAYWLPHRCFLMGASRWVSFFLLEGLPFCRLCYDTPDLLPRHLCAVFLYLLLSGKKEKGVEVGMTSSDLDYPGANPNMIMGGMSSWQLVPIHTMSSPIIA